MHENIVEAMLDTFVSPNERDRNGEDANIVDGLFAIARAVNNLADAVRENARSTGGGDGDDGN